MRWAAVSVFLLGCVAQPPAVDGPDTDLAAVDTAATDPVCAGLGQPCEALPPRPDRVACGAGLRDAVLADAAWSWPDSLAALGCFDDAHARTPTAGVLAYDVRAPLFSNGSDKGRYLVLPPGGTLTPSADGAWVFPTGTLLLKSFGLDLTVEGARAARTIEVRVMLLAQDGWKFSTYAWDEGSQGLRLVGEKGRTDALAVPHDDGDVLAWYYPSVEACLTCHRTVGEQVLAVRTRQLHHRVDYGAWVADQLVAWDAIGVFSPSIATLGALPTVADPYDPRTPAEPRARAWLHANCAHCHQPGGFAPPELSLDLRVTTAFADTATCMVPKHSGFTTGGQYVIVPGDAAASALVQRIRTESFEKMPPDGATRYDEGGIQAVEAWIDGLNGCP